MWECNELSNYGKKLYLKTIQTMKKMYLKSLGYPQMANVDFYTKTTYTSISLALPDILFLSTFTIYRI